MRRTKNVKPLLTQGRKKRYNVNQKKHLKMVKPHGFLAKGKEYNIKGKLADSLLKRGEAVEVKEEKAVITTKEEKFIPETKEEKFIGMYISIKNLALVLPGYTNEELREIIEKDTRVTAKRMATEELEKREGTTIS